MRDAEVEGILAQRLTAIAVVEQIICLVDQYLDGVLALCRLVGKRQFCLIEVWELFSQVLGEQTLLSLMTLLTNLWEGDVHVPCLLSTVRHDEFIFAILCVWRDFFTLLPIALFEYTSQI